MERYLTPEEVCNILQITLAQLRGIRERREIAWCKIGGSVRFTMQDVQDYADRVKVRAQRVQVIFSTIEAPAENTRRSRGRPSKSYQVAPGYVPGMRVV